MRNRNNEFILIIYIVQRKMVDFKCWELEIGLEFGRSSFAKRNNFSEGYSEPKKYFPSNSSAGGGSPRVFKLELLVRVKWRHLI